MTKRSEAAKKLAEVLFFNAGPRTESQIFEVLGDLGIEWPKEEPELPEALAFSNKAGGLVYIHIPAGSEHYLSWNLAQGTGPVAGSNHPGREWRDKILAELVRRYNVVGEVVKKMEKQFPATIEGHECFTGSSCIRDIYRKLKGIEP